MGVALKKGNVCGVLLEELPFRGGVVAAQRLISIISVLRKADFTVLEVFVRDHGVKASDAPHRVLVQRIGIGSKVLRRIASTVRRLPADRRNMFGFVVAAW